jgi:adenylate kinase family enzyme
VALSICIEGPSAVGKTTVAAELSRQLGVKVIPEVNQLFQRPVKEPKCWYFERQVERWKLSQSLAPETSFSILDGDTFQPFWYGWSFGFSELQSLVEMVAFYRPKIEAGEIEYPSKYLVFEASVEQLLTRKDGDKTRTRRNFEKHLGIIKPMKRYFSIVEQVVPEMVTFVPAGEVSEVAAVVASEAKKARLLSRDQNVALFEILVEKLAGESEP